jgi:hypothetical protein
MTEAIEVKDEMKDNTRKIKEKLINGKKDKLELNETRIEKIRTTTSGARKVLRRKFGRK